MEVRLASGKIVQVPDGLNRGAVQTWLLQNGATYQEVGIEPVEPETSGAAEDFLVGAGQWFSDRIPSLRSDVRAPDTFAASLGKAAPGIAASFAVPGSGLAGIASQAALAGGLEALDPAADRGDIGMAAAFAGAGTGLGDLASRVLTGIGRVASAARGPRRYLTTQSEALRTLAETTGGRGWVNTLNERALAATVARSFGENATELTDDVLLRASQKIGGKFEQLVPDTLIVNAPNAITALDNLRIGPKAKSLLPEGGQTSLQGGEYKNLRRALSDQAAALMKSDEADAMGIKWAIEQLDEAAEAASAPVFKPAFRRAREMWKNLKVAESLSTVRKGTGTVTPNALATALASGNGYGTSYIRNTGTVLPETQAMFDIARTAVRDNAGRVANSGTATRAGITAAAGGAAGLLTGATTPEVALAGLGTALAGQAAGVASVGRTLPGAGQAGAAAAGALPKPQRKPRK